MKIRSFIILFGLALLTATQCIAQTTEDEKEKIVNLIDESYIGAAHNNINIDILKNGFHESYSWQNMHHNRLDRK